MSRLSEPNSWFKEAMEDVCPHAIYPCGLETASNTQTKRVGGPVTQKNHVILSSISHFLSERIVRVT